MLTQEGRPRRVALLHMCCRAWPPDACTRSFLYTPTHVEHQVAVHGVLPPTSWGHDAALQVHHNRAAGSMGAHQEVKVAAPQHKLAAGHVCAGATNTTAAHHEAQGSGMVQKTSARAPCFSVSTLHARPWRPANQDACMPGGWAGDLRGCH